MDHRTAWDEHVARSGPHKPIGEAIGLALDRRIEYLDGVRIVLVSQHGAFRVQHKACRFHLLANSRRLYPMLAERGLGKTSLALEFYRWLNESVDDG
jgi:hypothetical protein